MDKPTLVIMAAGIGSRFGGLKQIEPVGLNGEIIIDYSIYDALKAGFGKVVFIINKNIEEAFKENIGNKIEKIVDTAYVYQRVEDAPSSLKIPVGRIKPWGTGHAVLSCMDEVNTPFAAINADDFYGPSSFQQIGKYLMKLKDMDALYHYCMIGFRLENTLTENGHVARGVCTVNADGYLEEIHERTKIQGFRDETKYTQDGEKWNVIPKGSIVSMNMWGFTTSIFSELNNQFPRFLKENKDNLEKAEYFLPSVVDRLISSGKADVKVLQSEERWYGVTYKDDKPIVKKAISEMVKRGIYPENLWEDII